MSKIYLNQGKHSSLKTEADRRSIAKRKLKLDHALSDSHAKLIVELHYGGDYE